VSKRTENTYRMAQQLAQLRAALMGETKSQYDISPLRGQLRPSLFIEWSPEGIQKFYETAVPVTGPLDTPCLFWSGSHDKDGYGIFYANGKKYAAHRLAYTLTHGAIPRGQHVLHLCDRPSCIRWEHLEAGEQGENMRQKSERGRAFNQHTPAIAKVPLLEVKPIEYLDGEIIV
jgi:hypothetical protein